MRTEDEMMNLILNFDSMDERIRVFGMESSRTNANVPKEISRITILVLS